MVGTIVVLEWTFSPPDYFEKPIEIPIEINRSKPIMKITDGKAETRIDPAVYEANPSMRDTLHNYLNNRFLGAQLISHRKYDLSGPLLTYIHPDGRRIIRPGPVKITSGFAMSADVTIYKNGKLIVDSRKNRIEEKKQFADLEDGEDYKEGLQDLCLLDGLVA